MKGKPFSQAKIRPLPKGKNNGRGKTRGRREKKYDHKVV